MFPVSPQRRKGNIPFKLGGRSGYFLFFSFSWAGEREEASEEVAGGAGFNKNRGEGGGVLSEEKAREREGRRGNVYGEGGG